jgi:hypothetical protein
VYICINIYCFTLYGFTTIAVDALCIIQIPFRTRAFISSNGSIGQKNSQLNETPENCSQPERALERASSPKSHLFSPITTFHQ